MDRDLIYKGRFEELKQEIAIGVEASAKRYLMNPARIGVTIAFTPNLANSLFLLSPFHERETLRKRLGFESFV